RRLWSALNPSRAVLGSARMPRMSEVVRVGLKAPEFELDCALPGGGTGRFKLSEQKGRWVALIFYPRDFSMVCPTELTGASARIEEFRAMECDLVGVSIDSVDVHAHW